MPGDAAPRRLNARRGVAGAHELAAAIDAAAIAAEDADDIDDADRPPTTSIGCGVRGGATTAEEEEAKPDPGVYSAAAVGAELCRLSRGVAPGAPRPPATNRLFALSAGDDIDTAIACCC